MATSILAEFPCAYDSDIDALAAAERLSQTTGYTAEDEADYLAGRLLTPEEFAEREEAEDEIAMVSSAEAWLQEWDESAFVFEA